MLISEYTDRELELLNLIEEGAPLWLPNPDNAPQIMAYLSDAHTIGFGGAAGGGKTDLIIGKTLNQHHISMIVREEGTQMTSIEDRFIALLKTQDGFNQQKRIWRLPKRGQQIEFGSIPNPGDETKYQGRPHDFLAFDEATNVQIRQIRYLSTWLRSAEGHRVEMLLTFNPPSTAEGRWVLDFFKPWLDKKNKTAEPGELRYYITIETTDIEVPKKPCVIVNSEPVFDFDPSEFSETQIIIPQSRTFIPSRVTDNSYLGQEYMMQLQALPEPLRSQMLEGDFSAGVQDDEWQVIPTAWVEAAMDRWTRPAALEPMDSMGVDVARGGQDNTIIARRHGNWYDIPLAYPGRETIDGPAVAGLVVVNRRDRAPVHLDVVGVGSSPYDFLKQANIQVIGVNGGVGSNETDRPGTMGFVNLKSQLWWQFREDLDPQYNTGVCLPRDNQLLKDLTAITWRPEGGKIRVEGRKEIIKRIGRSPDWGSAYVMARMNTPKIKEFLKVNSRTEDYDPYAFLME